MDDPQGAVPDQPGRFDQGQSQDDQPGVEDGVPEPTLGGGAATEGVAQTAGGGIQGPRQFPDFEHGQHQFREAVGVGAERGREGDAPAHDQRG